MKSSDELSFDPYHRRSIRLKGYDYSLPGGYFITLVAYQRESLFGKIIDGKILLSDFGKIVKNFWEAIPNRYDNVSLDSYIVMPNHLHGIIIIEEPLSNHDYSRIVGAGYKPALIKRYPLSEIIRDFKTYSSKIINGKRKMQGVPVWQRNYYEHVIRDDTEMNLVRLYITDNATKWNTDNENPMIF